MNHNCQVDEGRNWYSAHRGRLWIHAASKMPSDEEVRQVQDFYKARYGSKWWVTQHWEHF